MSAVLKRLAAFAPVLLAGCSTLSGGGPSASNMRKAPEVQVIDVTPDLAQAASRNATQGRADALTQALQTLRTPAVLPEFHFAPGDVFDLTVWSYSALPGSNTFAASTPTATPLGSFTLAADGSALLPYAGRLGLAGLTLDQAQQAIARRYAALRILQGPIASVKISSSPRSDVLVTGAVGHPVEIPWSPAGLSLAQAVTQALGDGNATLGQGDLSATRAAVRVSVEREGMAPAELPVAAAFEERIPLQPGDRVVVRKAPVVEVTMLGSGTRRNGVIGFAKQPVLAEALAEAGGLDNNVANDHAVFVLRRSEDARPVLYDFSWKQASALVAAQQFPLESGDVVYVAEAPIVSVQKVIGLLFQVTLPAQLIK